MAALKWSIKFLSGDELDKSWSAEMKGSGAMPAVPAIGDTITADWLSDGDGPGRAIVTNVSWTPGDRDPEMDVVVVAQRVSIGSGVKRKPSARKRK